MAASVRVEVDVQETLKARQRFPLFPGIVVGRFDSSIALYRAFDKAELKRILKSGQFSGGNYSVAAERAYGASWGHNLTEVIKGLSRERGRRIGMDLYIAKVDGFDHTFAHLDPEFPFDPDQPIVQMSADACRVGLGCSLFVDVSSVDAIYKLGDNEQLIALTTAQLKDEVKDVVLPEEEAPERVPEKVHGTFAVKAKEHFVVDKGSTQLGINVRNRGVVREVYQYDTWLEQRDTRVMVQLFFVWPVKGGPTRTLYARHPNRLKDFETGLTLQDGRGRKIIIRRQDRRPLIKSSLTYL